MDKYYKTYYCHFYVRRMHLKMRQFLHFQMHDNNKFCITRQLDTYVIKQQKLSGGTQQHPLKGNKCITMS